MNAEIIATALLEEGTGRFAALVMAKGKLYLKVVHQYDLQNGRTDVWSVDAIPIETARALMTFELVAPKGTK